jgi:hypothetical protein
VESIGRSFDIEKNGWHVDEVAGRVPSAAPTVGLTA